MALEVIGPGFGRTGTNSLRRALELLGFGPCHHMYELGDHAEQLPNWEALARGEAVDWDEVFAGYHAQVDWPGARFWRELCAYYPDAKVVLSVREPQGWYDSMEKTIVPHLERCGASDDESQNPRLLMNYELISRQTFAGRISERAYAIDRFNAHIAEVQAEITPERLLTFDVREGWGPLCAFLGVGVPDAPFPNTNNTKDFNDPNRTV
jgi:hypothetical protein